MKFLLAFKDFQIFHNVYGSNFTIRNLYTVLVAATVLAQYFLLVFTFPYSHVCLNIAVFFVSVIPHSDDFLLYIIILCWALWIHTNYFIRCMNKYQYRIHIYSCNEPNILQLVHIVLRKLKTFGRRLIYVCEYGKNKTCGKFRPRMQSSHVVSSSSLNISIIWYDHQLNCLTILWLY